MTLCDRCGGLYGIVLDGAPHVCEPGPRARYAALVRRWVLGMAAAHCVAVASGARFWLPGFAWDEAEHLCRLAYEQRKGWHEHGLDPAIVRWAA